MIRRAYIYDIPEVVEILSYTYDNLEDMELRLSINMRNKGYYTYYLDDDNTTLVAVERIGNFKAQFHIYTSKGSGGKRLKKLTKEVIEDLKRDHNYTSLLTFVPSDNRAGHFMAKIGGMEKIGVVNDAGGTGKSETLYSISIGGL